MKIKKISIFAFIPFLLIGCGNNLSSEDFSSSIVEPIELVSVEFPTSFSHYFESASFKFKKGETIFEAMIDIPTDGKLLSRNYAADQWKNKRVIQEQKIHEVDGYDQIGIYAADFMPSLEYISNCISYTDIRFTNKEFDDIKNQIKQYFENEDTKYTRSLDHNGLIYGEADILSYQNILIDEVYEYTIITLGRPTGTLYSNQAYLIDSHNDDYYDRMASFSLNKGQFAVNGFAVDSVSPDTTGEITFKIGCPSLEGKTYLDFKRAFTPDIDCSVTLPKSGENLRKLYLYENKIYNSATMYKVGTKIYTFTGDVDEDPVIKLTDEMIAQGIHVEFCVSPHNGYIIPCATNSDGDLEPTISCLVNDYKMFGRTAVYGGELYYYFWGTYSGLTY